MKPGGLGSASSAETVTRHGAHNHCDIIPLCSIVECVCPNVCACISVFDER
jgi:hypothetical protein